MAAILNPTSLTTHTDRSGHDRPGHDGAGLDGTGSIAPWNRAGALERRPVERHLHLVTDAPRVSSRRRPVRSILGGVALALLVALAAVGALQFLGADAAASTPASTTDITDPVGVDAAVASAPAAVQVSAPVAPAPVEVVVKSGETIWAVARRLKPHGDLRHLVDSLIERAGGASVSVGQHIDVSGLLD